MSNIIDQFKGKYYFLSNFSKHGFTYKEGHYKTVEHFFQAMKTLSAKDRKRIINAKTPSAAKRIGRKVNLRPNWNTLRHKVMKRALFEKFMQNTEFAQKLIDTGDAILIEGNTWHDNTWGNCICPKCNDVFGNNWLGQYLMALREYIYDRL